MNKLEKITKVDLREAWPNEQYDFTPWLEKEESASHPFPNEFIWMSPVWF